jgi:glycine cleavage system aminomethyltransferase T
VNVAAVRRSPITALHVELGARLVIKAGWEIVSSYGDEAAERTALREAVGMADVTPRGKIDVRGAIAGPLQGAEGGVLAQLSDDWALVLTEPGAELVVMSAMQERAHGSSVMVSDVTHAYAGFALAGPALGDVLARLTSWNAGTLGSGEATGASFAEVRAVMLNRPGELPMLELFVAAEFGRYVWETVAAVVARLGGRPAGWDALHAEGWT